jgi:uncharacterized membrane protein
MVGKKGEGTDTGPAVRTVLWSGIILGIGLIGSVDTFVFHQLLQWHHFYVHTDQFWRIASDGFFHIFTTFMLFFGAVRLWWQRRHISLILSSRPFWAGVLLGAGAFQLFDGTVFHKVLQIHPVREGVENILPYDIAWNVSALAILLIGWLLWRGVREGRR